MLMHDIAWRQRRWGRNESRQCLTTANPLRGGGKKRPWKPECEPTRDTIRKRVDRTAQDNIGPRDTTEPIKEYDLRRVRNKNREPPI